MRVVGTVLIMVRSQFSNSCSILSHSCCGVNLKRVRSLWVYYGWLKKFIIGHDISLEIIRIIARSEKSSLSAYTTHEIAVVLLSGIRLMKMNAIFTSSSVVHNTRILSPLENCPRNFRTKLLVAKSCLSKSGYLQFCSSHSYSEIQTERQNFTATLQYFSNKSRKNPQIEYDNSFLLNAVEVALS